MESMNNSNTEEILRARIAELEQQLAARVPDWSVLVDRGTLNMVINALRRDAEQGKSVRGEMADLLAAAPQPVAQECEWTNCPRRVGDVCCNKQPVAQPEQPAMVTPYITREHFDRAFPGQPAVQGEPVEECDKDPRGCWNVRCQLGKKCIKGAQQ